MSIHVSMYTRYLHYIANVYIVDTISLYNQIYVMCMHVCMCNMYNHNNV